MAIRVDVASLLHHTEHSLTAKLVLLIRFMVIIIILLLTVDAGLMATLFHDIRLMVRETPVDLNPKLIYLCCLRHVMVSLPQHLNLHSLGILILVQIIMLHQIWLPLQLQMTTRVRLQLLLVTVKLFITHIGSSSISTSSKSLYLNDILHVPSITKPLLSVQIFCKDNNCFFEFHPDFCLVKD